MVSPFEYYDCQRVVPKALLTTGNTAWYKMMANIFCLNTCKSENVKNL